MIRGDDEGVPEDEMVARLPAPAPTLSALLQGAAQNDRTAFKHLYAAIGPRIKGYVLRMCRETGLAEEITQEVLLTVWRRAHNYDPTRARAETWIFTIARNLKIDRFRKQARAEIDWTDPALVPDPLESADDLVLQGQDRKRIESALTGLTAEQRQVVELCFYKDLSHSQIATRLEIPIGTVKSRIRLAVGKLRAALENA